MGLVAAVAVGKIVTPVAGLDPVLVTVTVMVTLVPMITGSGVCVRVVIARSLKTVVLAILETKAWVPVVGAFGTGLTAGKSPDWLVPVTYALPCGSSAIPPC